MRFKQTLQSPTFTAEHIDVLQVSRPEGYTHSNRNGRIKHGFIYVVSGGMLFSMVPGGKTIATDSGQLVFIPKGCTYTSTYLKEDTQIQIVQFDLTSGILPDYLQSPVMLPLPDGAELMGAFFRRPEGSAPFYYLSCFYALLWQVDRQRSHIPSRYRKLLPALSVLTDRYEENLPVSHYAELCRMSEPNFRRLFKAYTGHSPVEYRNTLRLNTARALLQSGEYNVTEAAEVAGFSNLSFFIRLYKKKYGYSPKKE